MEFLFELILELFLEGSIEASSNKKLSKWIRYPLMILVILFFLFVISLIFLTGFLSFSTNKVFSICILLIGIVMLAGTIWKFKNLYFKRNRIIFCIILFFILTNVIYCYILNITVRGDV